MNKFFSDLNDEDFFSNKLTHIYLHNKITIKTINKLIEDVRNANNITNPKPILIHIACSGGSFVDGLRLLSVFKISKLPIATIIDNYSFSAATFLSVNSPYRIMTQQSFCLLHEYSVKGFINKKKKEIDYYLNSLDIYYNSVINMYLKKTKLKKSELIELLQHDYYLSYDFCYSKGIVDRVIFANTKTNTKMKIKPKIDINSILINSKNTQILFKCFCSFEEIDNTISNCNINNICLLYPIYNDCKKKTIKTSLDQDIYNIMNNYALIPRVQALQSALKIAIIDSPITLDKLLPLLYADKIFIYNYSYIICDYNYNDVYNKNINLIFNIMKSILKNKTKMKQSTINEINDKYFNISPKQAKEWGLCTDIIYTF
jgi:ATP-dependent protease ClpP protease subunit